MPTYELTISPNYVKDWGVVEAVREIFQNAIDQQEVCPDNSMLFSYDAALQVLKIGNKQSKLEMSSLVLGNTTKATDSRMIGKFGEGYKLALVVLLRMGKAVSIYNNPQVWTPAIVTSEVFKTPILSINVVKYRFKALPEHDLIFEIRGITPTEYEEIVQSNLNLQQTAGETIEHTYGRVLLDERHKGRIYVRGLFVTQLDDAAYGYDFKPEHLKIGRDRDLVSDFDIFWKTASVWASASGHEERVKQLLEDNAPDVHNLQHHVYAMPTETVRFISDCWYGEHGCRAYPVSSQAEADKVLNVYGGSVKTIIVTPQLLAILRRSDQFKGVTNSSAKELLKKTPSELLKKLLKHRDKMGSAMRHDFDAVLTLAQHWTWQQ